MKKQMNEIAMIFGVLWVAGVMSLLLFTNSLEIISNYVNVYGCSSCTPASMTEVVLIAALFFIGTISFAYGFINRVGISKAPKRSGVISFALLTALASMVVYFLLNLIVHGL